VLNSDTLIVVLVPGHGLVPGLVPVFGIHVSWNVFGGFGDDDDHPVGLEIGPALGLGLGLVWKHGFCGACYVFGVFLPFVLGLGLVLVLVLVLVRSLYNNATKKFLKIL
jgi:hypothetical protein